MWRRECKSLYGAYTAILLVSVAVSCTTTGCRDINLNDPPPNPGVVTGPAFSANPTTGNIPLNVTFTNQTQGDIISRSWSFGDGATSIENNPSHVYAREGSYSVTLVCRDSAGTDTLTKTNFITATTGPAPLNAEFTASPTSGNSPLAVQFANQSTGSITSYQWSFGDGGTSDAQTPSHTYSSNGRFTVRLIVVGATGADTSIRIDYISATTNVPVANFSATPTSGPKPLKVQFTSTSSGTISTYRWSFGNGATSSSKNPSYTYNQKGKYTVKLKVTGPGGSDELVRTNFIEVKNVRPTSEFLGSPLSGAPPLTVQFTNSSTGDISANVWSFGDGGVSTSTNPSHQYTSAGVYDVSLLVLGPDGSDTTTKSGYIAVASPAPRAAFSAGPRSGNSPLSVSFSDQSTGSISSREWSFGDGVTSTQRNPSHQYTSNGSYNVSLSVLGSGGSDTEVKNNYITVSCASPIANFTGNPRSGMPGLTVSFTNTSTGLYDTFSWEFGDGGTSTGANPSYTYTAEGTYTVKLTVNGSCGSDTKTESGYITITAPVPQCQNIGHTVGVHGPFWPVLVQGDCSLAVGNDGSPITGGGSGPEVKILIELVLRNSGKELWAVISMEIQEDSEDNSKAQTSQELYLGFTAPSGWKIDRIEGSQTEEWKYNDEDNDYDSKSFDLCVIRAMGQTEGDDICGTTRDDSHFIVEFNPITLKICEE